MLYGHIVNKYLPEVWHLRDFFFSSPSEDPFSCPFFKIKIDDLKVKLLKLYVMGKLVYKHKANPKFWKYLVFYHGRIAT